MHVGLAVMRLQPLHRGHTAIINRMNEECDVSIIGLGSVQETNRWNPYSAEQRKQMIKNVYGDRVKIVPLNDISTERGTNDWVKYVIERITKIGLPEPSHYYSGSEADACWYTNWFEKDCLHILPRQFNVYPSATEIRTFLETRNEAWKKYVPKVNWDIVKTFPEGYKV